MAASNHALVARELPIQGQTRPSQPDQRMKPQHAKAGFVNKACEVVAPSGVGQFVDEYGVDLRLAQEPVDSIGKRDPGTQNPGHLGTLSVGGELYRYAMRKEARPLLTTAAALDAYPPQE